MQQLQVVEHGNMRVLTTIQLADAFGTNKKLITNNFQRNKKQYIPEEHYFELSGEALRQFKAIHHSDADLKFIPKLYLWTEKGAWLHAKSLNNDKAWNAYSALIDSYYKITAHNQLSKVDTNMMLTLTNADWAQVQHRLEVLEMQIQEVTLHSGEQTRLRNAVGERVHQLTNENGARPALFRAIYSAIREEYGVGSYRDVKRYQLQDALRFVEKWGD